MDYWERNRAVFRVVELTTVEGDLRFQGLRVRALNAVTVTLARVIATHAEASGSPAGADPMAAAGTLIAMLAQVAGHRYGFEFWGIRTASLVDSQARLLHWSVTGRPAPAGPGWPGRRCPLPRTGPVVGGGAALGPHRPGQGGLGPGAPPSGRPAPDPAQRERRTGLTGEPRALVKGSGVASSRNVVAAVGGAGVGQLVEEPVLALGHPHLHQMEEVHGQGEVGILAGVDLEHHGVDGHRGHVAGVEPLGRGHGQARGGPGVGRRGRAPARAPPMPGRPGRARWAIWPVRTSTTSPGSTVRPPRAQAASRSSGVMG